SVLFFDPLIGRGPMKTKENFCLIGCIMLISIIPLFFLGSFLFFSFKFIEMVCSNGFPMFFYNSTGFSLLLCASLIGVISIFGLLALFFCVQFPGNIREIREFYAKAEKEKGKGNGHEQ
ncbi:MAG: hypothetical protein ABIH00_01110, partial [Armatimonadota bacterium]